MDYKLSLYQAVEVEIGGQKYPLHKLNRPRIRALSEIAERESKLEPGFATIESRYEELALLVDAPAAVLDELSIEQVGELRKIIDAEVFKVQPVETPVENDPEKNAPKPGEEAAV